MAKVFDFECEHGHSFEAWINPEEDWRVCAQKGELVCPICDGAVVRRALAAPYVKTSQHVEQKLMHAFKNYVQQAEDVGNRLPEVARDQKRGVLPEKPVRGHCSLDEAQALAEEGIDIMPIPEHFLHKDN